MNQCFFCQKEIEKYLNYCSWECHVEQAKAAGGKAFLPNGLPVGCIRHDGNMYEMEGGDHPDYKFPVYVELYGGAEFDEEEGFRGEYHALLYTDGNIAVTLYERCYAMWYLRNGELAGGSLWKKGEWRLSQESLEKIKKLSA